MKKTTSKKLLIALGVAVLGIIATLRYADRSRTVYTLTTVQALPRDITVTVNASGDLESEGAVNISAPDIKYTKKITFLLPEGTIVKEGDIVAVFDTIQLEERLESLLRAGLYARLQDTEIARTIAVDDCKANLASKQENEKIARLTYETMAYAPKLEQQKSEIQLNQAVANVKLAENRLKQEEQKWELKLRQVHELIEQNEKEVEETRSSIDALTIRAPCEGLVVYPKTRVMGTERKVQLGDTLYKDQRFMILPNLFKMTAQVEVAEEDIRRIRIGQFAQIYLEAFKDAVFTGEIYRIDRLAHVKENNPFIKVFTVGIRINEQDLDRLRPGMNARVIIDADTYMQATALPLNTIYTDADGDWIFVQGEEGPQKIRIDLADASEEWAVLSEDVAEPVILLNRSFKDWLNDSQHDTAVVRWEAAP